MPQRKCSFVYVAIGEKRFFSPSIKLVEEPEGPAGAVGILMSRADLEKMLAALETRQ